MDKIINWGKEIEKSIEEGYRDTTSLEGLQNVLFTVVQAMAGGATVLVPVTVPDAAVRIFDPEKIKEGDVIQVDEELHFKMIVIDRDNGTADMPVFTSKEKMEEADANCSTFEMPLMDHVRNILDMPGANGLSINPSEHGFFVDREMLEHMLEFLEMHRAGGSGGPHGPRGRTKLS